jgi:hypothetical protein
MGMSEEYFCEVRTSLREGKRMRGEVETPFGIATGRNPSGWRALPALRLSACAALVALFLVGCGYRFVGDGESIPPTVRTVFVDVFANKTSEVYAETFVRTAFINQFVQNSRLRLVRNRGEADAICRGTVKNLLASPLAYKAGGLSAENRLTITLEISFEERESGRTIWADRTFTGTGDYLVTTVGDTETSRKNALIKLANDTAERAYRLMLSGF